MGDGHDHVSATSAAGGHKRPLLLALAITAAFMVVEVVVGFTTGSLALIGDAGHMLTDVAGLGMALAAIQVAESSRDPRRTYGLFRLEVLAPLANAVLLFAVAGYVLFEAARRFAASLLVVANALRLLRGSPGGRLRGLPMLPATRGPAGPDDRPRQGAGEEAMDCCAGDGPGCSGAEAASGAGGDR